MHVRVARLGRDTTGADCGWRGLYDAGLPPYCHFGLPVTHGCLLTLSQWVTLASSRHAACTPAIKAFADPLLNPKSLNSVDIVTAR